MSPVGSDKDLEILHIVLAISLARSQSKKAPEAIFGRAYLTNLLGKFADVGDEHVKLTRDQEDVRR
jgi:hypothetical protein